MTQEVAVLEAQQIELAANRDYAGLTRLQVDVERLTGQIKARAHSPFWHAASSGCFANRRTPGGRFYGERVNAWRCGLLSIPTAQAETEARAERLREAQAEVRRKAQAAAEARKQAMEAEARWKAKVEANKKAQAQARPEPSSRPAPCVAHS